MSNYTVTTNFGTKDSLPSGNGAKVIKGSEFTTEFNNIATASATKADLASPTFTGTVTIPTATITTANTTTANITTANCDNLTVEKAANNADLSLLIHNTGTGEADATLTLDSSATGESEINFLHDGSLGATIEYFVDGGSPDLNIKTLTSGSVIDLQPNNVNTLRAAEGVVTVTGDLRISDGSVKGEIGLVGDDVYLADNIAGIRISGADTNNIFSCDENGTATHKVTNFGTPTHSWKTGYFEELIVEKAGDAKITIKGTNSGGDDDDAELFLDSNGNGESAIRFQTDGTDGAALFWSPQSNDDLVIQTYSAASDGGIHLRVKEEDSLLVKADGVLQLSDGAVKGTVGILTGSSDVYFADAIAGIRVSGAGTNNIFPCDSAGASTDGVTDLGTSIHRWKTGNFTGLDVQSLSTGDNADCRVNITSRGTGDSDATLHLDANDTGEAEIEFAVGGTIGADVIWTTESNDRFVVTTLAGTDAPIILEPNNNPLVSAAEGQFTVDGQIRLGDVSGTGVTTPLATIGLVSTDEVFIADAVCGLRMSGAGTINIFPVDGNGVGTTEIANLGTSNDRFKTIFSKNALDTSSDRNLKQSIEELSEAEVRVAQVCKGLIRKYKWKDSVERKGVDGSRYHVGVIAQDLEAAFAAEGLNAEEYGMFTRSEETGTLSVSYSELLAFIIGGL